MTVLESIKGINAYPIPLLAITGAAGYRGLDLSAEATQKAMQSKEYNLCKADLLLWLSMAPDISQGGINYTFADTQRLSLRNQANAIYRECEADNAQAKAIYGYKGSRL